MRCIIVDDEPLAREGLELKVARLGFLTLEASLASGTEAYEYLATHETDLMFLDIHMPDMTGLELLKTLKNPPIVILTTAYSEYALQGYELDVIDYLVKPIEYDRFLKAVQKALDLHKLQTQTEVGQVQSVHEDFLFVRADRQYIKVYFREIVYLEGMKNYVIFHTLHDGKIITAISLSVSLGHLPATEFARVNRSYIINVKQVRRVLPDFIVLKDGTEIPFGKNYQKDFIEVYVKGNLLER